VKEGRQCFIAEGLIVWEDDVFMFFVSGVFDFVPTTKKGTIEIPNQVRQILLHMFA
jgi:hypothetical protein